MEDRHITIDIAGDVDRQIADPHGGAVVLGQPPLVERHAQILQPKAFDIGPPADADQHSVDLDLTLADLDLDHLAGGRQFRLRAEPHREFLADDLDGMPVDDLIAETGDPLHRIDADHLDADPRQRLPQFETDHAQPEHDDGIGHSLQFEKAIGGHHCVAELGPGPRQDGRRAGGDHDRLRLDLFLVDDQRIGAGDAGITLDQLVVEMVRGAAKHAIDEGIAQVAHMLHHLFVIDAQPIAAHDAFTLENVATVKIFRHLNEGLGRHAAHPRAGGAQLAAVDQHEGFAGPAHLPHGIEPGRSGADDGDVYFSCHGVVIVR